MVLNMPRPYKHPKTGVYWYRQRVPSHLTDLAIGKTVAVTVGGNLSRPKLGAAIQISLRTKSPQEAHQLATEAQTEFNRIWTSLSAGPVKLTLKQMVALSGEAYNIFAFLEDDPGKPSIWANVQLANADAAAGRSLYIGKRKALEVRFGPFVDWALERHALVVDDETYQSLLDHFARALTDIAVLLERRATGDYGPDSSSLRFPSLDLGSKPTSAPTRVEATPSKSLSLTFLLDRKQATQSKKSKTFSSYRGALLDFAKVAGHEDALKITLDEVRNWRDVLVGRGLTPKTINGRYLAALKSTLQHGRKEYNLPENVASLISDERNPPAPSGPKDYSPEQVKIILEATFRGSKKQLSAPCERAVFWVPWICAYTGLRVNEVTQLSGRNLRSEGAVTYLLITPEDGSTKGGNAWIAGVHPHLIELGLVEMFRAVGDGAAFYTPYPHNVDLRSLPSHRAADSGDSVAEWVSKELGIAAPGGKPNHAWRHTFTTLSRIHGLDKEARDYMLGSRSKADAREGYGQWSPQVIDAEIRKLPRFDVNETEWRPSLERVQPTAARHPSLQGKRTD